MFESIRSIWNFSLKRQHQLAKILLLSFIEGIFVMLKMIAIIFAVSAMFNRFLVDSYIYKIIILGIICIAGVFVFGYFTQLGSVSVGFEMAKDKRLYFGSFFKKLYLGFFNENSVGNINSTLTTSISHIEKVFYFIHQTFDNEESQSALFHFFYDRLFYFFCIKSDSLIAHLNGQLPVFHLKM